VKVFDNLATGATFVEYQKLCYESNDSATGVWLRQIDKKDPVAKKMLKSIAQNYSFTNVEKIQTPLQHTWKFLHKKHEILAAICEFFLCILFTIFYHIL
jgi:hypothetical protein